MKFMLTILCGIFILFQSTLQAQQAPVSHISDPLMVSYWFFGQDYSIAADGQYVFLGNGDGVTIFDISNPSRPASISQVLTKQWTYTIYIKGDTLFAGGTYQLFMVDISDIAHPTIVSNLDSLKAGMSTYKAALYHNGYLYATTESYASAERGLFIYNVTANPTPVREAFIQGNSDGTSLAATGNYLYWGTENQLLILDISNPTAPQTLNTLNIKVTSLVIGGDYLYVGSESERKVTIYSISDPANPQQVTTISVRNVHLVYRNNKLYIDPNLVIYDVSDPQNPQYISETSHSSGHGIALTDTIAVTAAPDGFTTLSIADPQNPLELYYFKNSIGGIQNIFIADSLVYLAATLGMKPINMASFDTPRGLPDFSGNNAIYVRGTTVFAGIRSSIGIIVYDMQDPYHPTVIYDSYNLGLSEPMNFQVRGDTLYSAGKRELAVVDISDSTNLQLLGRWNASKDGLTTFDVRLFGHYAFFLNGAGTVDILNIQDPASIQVVGSIDSTGNHFTVEGNYLYLAGDQFHIFDISNPQSPQIISSTPINLEAFYSKVTDVVVWGNFAFISEQKYIHAYDISNKQSPQRIALFESHWNISTMEVKDGYLYGAGYGFENLFVLDVNYFVTDIHTPDLPTSLINQFELYPNYPNPFNPSTTISFTLPRSGNVEIVVFDISGRRVQTLIDTPLPAGRHQVVWNGRDASNRPVSSGVYFYRLSVDNQVVKTRKMIFQK